MITVDIKSLLGRLNPFCRAGLEAAAGICVARSHYEVTVEHVLQQLLEEPHSDFSLILKQYEIRHEEVKGELNAILEEFPTGNGARPVFSPRLIEWYQEAQLAGSVELDEPQIRSGVLLLAFLSRAAQFSTPAMVDILGKISREDLLERFSKIVKNSVEEKSPKKAMPVQTESKTALGQYCEDFTQKARDGLIDPVFGRDSEIRQVVDIFARRRKNNPIVVGEAGVGKTALVEGLALRIVDGDVPDFLKNVTLMGLDMGFLQAGAGVKGEFENRLKRVIEEVKASEKPIIMFIDEAHTMIGAGGAAGGSDAANLLKPALARGELRTIAATTWSEYKKYFEKDAALARRFQLVYLEEPSVDTSTLILRGLKEKYEQAHGVVIRDDAVQAACELSGRYISGRYLPDKAIDLLDTSAARVKVLLTAKPDTVEAVERRLQAAVREKEGLERDTLYGVGTGGERLLELESEVDGLEEELKVITGGWKKESEVATRLIALRQKLYGSACSEMSGEMGEEPDLKEMIVGTTEELQQLQQNRALVRTEVDPEIVSQVVSDWTGIPVGKLMHDEARRIVGMEENLKKRIRGQDRAIAEISRIIRAARAGLKDPEQPSGVFLLTGPSGVGKTETGLAVAELLFGGERFTVSINMSEFQEKHTVSRLIGSPPGYVGYGEGGILTEAVRQRPYSVVLLDEVEKANPEVLNLFYQIFDKGVLADGEGRNINFKNTVIFMTSNLASDLITELDRSHEEMTSETIQSAIRPLLSHHFKPALLARMTIVPFVPLRSDIMTEIVTMKLRQVADRLKNTHKITLQWALEVPEQISARCFEVETGARNINHIMDGTILPLISQEILTWLSQGALPPEIKLGLSEEGAFVLFS